MLLINTMGTAAGEAVVEIRGVIDAANIVRVRRVVTAASRLWPTSVVVDLL